MNKLYFLPSFLPIDSDLFRGVLLETLTKLLFTQIASLQGEFYMPSSHKICDLKTGINQFLSLYLPTCHLFFIYFYILPINYYVLIRSMCSRKCK